MQIIKDFDIKLILELIALFIFIFLGIHNVIFYFLALGLNIFCLIFDNKKRVFSQLFFLLPFSMIYKYSPSTSSFFTYGVIVASAIMFVKNGIKNVNIFLAFVLLCIYIFIGADQQITLLMKIISSYFLLLMYVQITEIEDVKAHILSFSVGVLFSSFIGLFKISNPSILRYFTETKSEHMNGEEVFRFTGLFLDPNFYSIAVVISIFLLMRLIQAKAIDNRFGYTLVAIFCVFGALTYSRMFILAFVLLIIYYIQSTVIQSKYRFIILIIFLFVIIIGITYLIKSDYFVHLSARFDTDDLSDHRTTIWTYYMYDMLKSPLHLLVGKGLGAELVAGSATHNTYIEILYYLGILGGLLYFFFIYRIFMLKDSLIYNKFKRLYLLMIYSIMIATLACLETNEMPFYIMLLWISYYYDDASLTSCYKISNF